MKTILCFFGLSFVGWICLIVGFVKTRRFKARMETETVRTEGVITGYEERQKSWGRSVTTAFYPVVCFTVSGHEYKATADFYYLKPLLEGDKERPPEGTKVTLYYNPGNPFKFRLEQDRNEDGKGLIRISGFIFVFAAVASVAAALILKW